MCFSSESFSRCKDLTLHSNLNIVQHYYGESIAKIIYSTIYPPLKPYHLFFFNLKFIFYLKLYHKHLEKYIIDEFHYIFHDMNILSTNVL